jgi:hypothetical protein
MRSRAWMFCSARFSALLPPSACSWHCSGQRDGVGVRLYVHGHIHLDRNHWNCIGQAQCAVPRKQESAVATLARGQCRSLQAWQDHPEGGLVAGDDRKECRHGADHAVHVHIQVIGANLFNTM